MLVTAWLLGLTGGLLANGYWGWALLTIAGAVAGPRVARRPGLPPRRGRTIGPAADCSRGAMLALWLSSHLCRIPPASIRLRGRQ
jgi:hypothetical protein